MSKTIENNVVQMTFDNKDFEKNISTSTKSVEKFNDSLDFKDAKKGFDDLEKYANSVNFDGLNKAIGNINSVFTVTGNMTKKIIDDIAGYFESKIVGTVSKVRNTISYIADTNLGVSKYEDYLNAIKTLRYNLSDTDLKAIKVSGMSDLDYIADKFSTIMDFTDETSFNMLDMVNAISKYASANVSLEDSSEALMGTALAAAAAGKNSQQAGQAMSQMVQAISRGYFQMKDWNEAFANNAIATRHFKEIMIEAAMGLGKAATINEEDIAQAKEWAEKTNGQWYDFFYESKKMNDDKWLTTEALIAGLKEYSKSSTIIFDTVAKLEDTSVSQLVQWSKEFLKLKSSGVTAIEYVNYLGDSFSGTDKDAILLAKTLDKLTSEEYKLATQAFIAGQQATNFHEAIDAGREAFGTKMMALLEGFIGDLDQASSLWTIFADNLWSVFAGPLDAAIDGMKQFNTEIAGTTEVAGHLVEQTWYDQFWLSIRRIFGGGAEFVNGFINQIRILGGAFKEVDGELEIGSLIENNTFGFMQKLTNGVTAMADAIEKFLNSTLYENMLGIFMNILKIISNIKSVTSSLLRATVGTILKNLGKPLTALSELILKITGIIEEKSTKFVNSDIFKNIVKWLTSIIDAVSKLAGTVLSKLFNILGKIADIAGDFFGEAVRFLKPIFTWLHDRISPALKDIYEFLADKLNEALDWVSDKLDHVGDAWDYIKLKAGEAKDTVKDFIEGLMGTDFDTLGEKLKNFGKNFMEGASGIGGRSLDVIKEYGKNMFDENTDGSFPNLFKRLDDAGTAIEGAQTTIRWLGDALSNPIYFIFDLVGAVLNTDLSGAADALCNFIKRVTGAIADITPSALEFLSKVISFLGFLIEKAVELIKSIVGFATGTLSSTGNTILDKVIDAVIKILDLFLEGMIAILIVLGHLAELIKPAVLEALDLAEQFITKLVDKFREIAQNLADASGGDIVKAVIGTAMIVAGLWLFFGVMKAVIDVTYAIKGLGSPLAHLSHTLGYVFESGSELLDTLGGYSTAGKFLYMSLLLFAIADAVDSMVAVAEYFSSPERRKQFLQAMAAVITFILIILFSIKMVLNTLAGGSKNKLSATFAKNIDTDIGIALIGIGVFMIGVSKAMSTLVDATKDMTDPKILLYAGMVISLILLSLGKTIKMVQGESSVTRGIKADKTGIFKSNVTGSSAKSGTSYSGIPFVITSMATAISVIMLAMGFLAKTIDGMEDPMFILAVWGMAELLLFSIAYIIKEFFKFSTSSEAKEFSKFKGGKSSSSSKSGNGGILNAVGVSIIIMSISAFVATVMVSVIILAAIVQAAGIDPDLIMTIMGLVVVLILAIGLSMKLIMDAESRQLAKIGVKELLQRIGKMIGFSVVFVALGVCIAALGTAINNIAKTAMEYDNKLKESGMLKTDKDMNPVTKAFLMIAGILTMIFVGTTILTSIAKKMDVGSIMSVAMIIFGCALMIKNIGESIRILTETFSEFEDEPDAIAGAILSLVGIMMAMAVLVMVIGAVGAMLGASNGGGDAGDAIIKLALGFLVLSLSIKVITSCIVSLATAIHTFGDTGPIWEALNIGVLVLVGMAAAMVLLGAIALIFGKQIVTLGIGLAIIAASFLALDLAILLLVPAIELASNYLVTNSNKIAGAFVAIGRAIADAILGSFLGLLKSVYTLGPQIISTILGILLELIRAVADFFLDPETGVEIGKAIYALLKATAIALVSALVWFLDDVGDFLNSIMDYIKKWANDAIGDSGLVRFLKAIVKTLTFWIDVILQPFRWIIKGVKKLFGIGSPSTVFEGFGKWIMQGLLNGLNKLKDAILAPFKWIAEKVSNIWNGMVNACESMMERLAGRDFQQEMADKMASIDQDTTHYRASMAVENAQAYFDVLRKLSSGNINTAERANLEATKSKLEKNIKAMKKVAWDAAKEMGYETTAGFFEGINSGGDMRKLGEQYMNTFIDGGKKAADIHSPSGVMKTIGNYLLEGLLNGLDISSMFGTGEGMMDNLMGGVSSAMPDMSSLGGEAASMFNGGFADNLDLTASGATFDMSGYDTKLGGGYSSIGSIDSMNFASSGGYSGLDASYAMNSATAMPDTVNYTSEDITNELKAMNKKLDAFQEAVDKMQDLDIYLDNGVLAGALAGPIDEELGRRANRKAARGGI